MAGRDRRPQRRARGEQMRLSHELLETARPGAYRQRPAGVLAAARAVTVGHTRGGIFSQIVPRILVKKGIHVQVSIARVPEPPFTGSGRLPTTVVEVLGSVS